MSLSVYLFILILSLAGGIYLYFFVTSFKPKNEADENINQENETLIKEILFKKTFNVIDENLKQKYCNYMQTMYLRQLGIINYMLKNNEQFHALVDIDNYVYETQKYIDNFIHCPSKTQAFKFLEDVYNVKVLKLEIKESESNPILSKYKATIQFNDVITDITNIIEKNKVESKVLDKLIEFCIKIQGIN